MITKAEMVGEHTALVAWDEEPFDGIKVIAAKAADELLNVAEINGAFVMYENGGTVHISGRCDTNYNVQIIMEKMGGGGHRSAAGAQLKDRTLEEVKTELNRKESKNESSIISRRKRSGEKGRYR